MDIQELKQRKSRLIKEMSDSIRSFENDTGIMPSGIHVCIECSSNVRGDLKLLLRQIDVNLDI